MENLNKNFDNWFHKLEGSHIRSELFWDDVNNNRRRKIYEWLQSAYEIGYDEGQRLYGGTE